MTIYKEVNRQRQSWHGRQAAQPEAAVTLPFGKYELSRRSSGLWGFEAEGTAYTIKKRQTESTKPNLYIMAELKPKPAYVSSLYWQAHTSGETEWTVPPLKGNPYEAQYRAWHYTAQAPAADSPLLYVSLWGFERQAEPYSLEWGRFKITVMPDIAQALQALAIAADYASVYSQAFID